MKQFLITKIDQTFKNLFELLTESQSHAQIVRFAITFLDIWQAIILLNHNYWIPQLVDIATPLYYYEIYSVILAILAILSLIFSEFVWLGLFVLALNSITYMFLAIASVWYFDPPRASVGFSVFVMLISISAFWRIFLSIIRNRVTHKRT